MEKLNSIGIVYFGDLKGDKMFDSAYPKNTGQTYLDVIKDAASYYQGAEVIPVEYQTEKNRFPLISEMGQTAADAMIKASQKHDALILVGSSVGAGVILEGVDYYLREGEKPVVGTILIGGVYDPVTLLHQTVAPHGMDALRDGLIPAIPVPVPAGKDQADPGAFMFSKAHTEDMLAVRILHEHPGETNADAVLRKLRTADINLRIMTAAHDDLSPPAQAEWLLNMIGKQPSAANLTVWQGGHNECSEQRFDDLHDTLVDILHENLGAVYAGARPATLAGKPGAPAQK